MSRKPRKGYYVRGQFVAEGSELDQELRREQLAEPLRRLEIERTVPRAGSAEYAQTIHADDYRRLGHWFACASPRTSFGVPSVLSG